MTYSIQWSSSAQRDLNKLTLAVASAVAEYIGGDLADSPHRCCGKPLGPPLEGKYRAKRGGYRIILSIDDGQKVIVIENIKARPHAYRR